MTTASVRRPDVGGQARPPLARASRRRNSTVGATVVQPPELHLHPFEPGALGPGPHVHLDSIAVRPRKDHKVAEDEMQRLESVAIVSEVFRRRSDDDIETVILERRNHVGLMRGEIRRRRKIDPPFVIGLGAREELFDLPAGRKKAVVATGGEGRLELQPVGAQEDGVEVLVPEADGAAPRAVGEHGLERQSGASKPSTRLAQRRPPTLRGWACRPARARSRASTRLSGAPCEDTSRASWA